MLYYLLTFNLSAAAEENTGYLYCCITCWRSVQFPVAAGQNTRYLYYCITCWRSVFQWRQDRIQDTFIVVLPAYVRFFSGSRTESGYLYCCCTCAADVRCFSGGRSEYRIPLLLYKCITFWRFLQWWQDRIHDTFITVLPTVVQSVSGGRTEYRIPLLLAVLPADVRSFGGGRTEYSASCITCWRSVFQYWQDRIQDTFIAALPSDFFFFFWWRQIRIHIFIAVLPAVVKSFSGGRSEYRIPLFLYYPLSFTTEYRIPLSLYYSLSFTIEYRIPLFLYYSLSFTTEYRIPLFLYYPLSCGCNQASNPIEQRPSSQSPNCGNRGPILAV